MNHLEIRKFFKSLFLIVQIWVLREKKFLLQFLVDILPLGSESVDPHIFADPDPGSQNLADPTDPDPKHWDKLFVIWIRRPKKTNSNSGET